MRDVFLLLSKALIIALAFAAIGLLANQASEDPLPLAYIPPKEIVLEGVRVPLINEKEAVKLLKDPETVFVDSRSFPEYARSHVKGAVCLPPDDVAQRFPTVEPLVPIESRVILYCHGPECDMAEKVAAFLGQIGYRRLMIMSSGFPAWEKANYPVEGVREKGGDSEDLREGTTEEEARLSESPQQMSAYNMARVIRQDYDHSGQNTTTLFQRRDQNDHD